MSSILSQPQVVRRNRVLLFFRRYPLATLGLALVLICVLASLAAPLFTDLNPNKIDPVARLSPPGTQGHPLGTDEAGRDILSRMLYGGRITLFIGFAASLIATLFGSFVGLLAGYSNIVMDNVLMRLMDILLAFPFILLAIMIVAFAGPGLLNTLIAVAIVNIPFYARIIRSSVVTTREAEYIVAAVSLGARPLGVIFKHLLPAALPLIIVTASINIGWMITQSAALSFLGLGTQPPTADWGTMLGQGKQYLTVAPHAATIPGLAIFIVVLGFNLLGDGVRDALDPRLKKR
jgi:peptide/nickel transport system permease protein